MAFDTQLDSIMSTPRNWWLSILSWTLSFSLCLFLRCSRFLCTTHKDGTGKDTLEGLFFFFIYIRPLYQEFDSIIWDSLFVPLKVTIQMRSKEHAVFNGTFSILVFAPLLVGSNNYHVLIWYLVVRITLTVAAPPRYLIVWKNSNTSSSHLKSFFLDQSARVYLTVLLTNL